MSILGKKEGRKLLNFIRTLPLIWGWSREKFAHKLSWLMLPAENDDSLDAQELRELISGYQVESLARQPTIFFNRPPFTEMLQLGIAFDRFLETCHKAKVEPFGLERHINGLNRGTIGKWVGGLEYPSAGIRENLNRFLQHKAGFDSAINFFQKTPDVDLIRSGYLIDTRPEMEKNNHGGCRQFGNDPLLRLTTLAASYPMFRYLEKELMIGFWGETVYQVKIPDTRKYIRRCAHFGEKRWTMLCKVKRYSLYVDKFTGLSNEQVITG